MGSTGVRERAALVGIVAVVLLIVSFVPVAGLARGGPSSSSTESTQVTPGVVPSAPPARPVTEGASPHPGTLEAWDVGPGTTLDPSAEYYTVNNEPVENVYQTLIAYNGSDDGQSPSSFVPELATCVPGSNECISQFGSSLVFNNATTGAPQYFTFEIDAGAHFYDPAHNASWGVYPSDVLFSLVRTLGFADYPGFGVYNGWITAQTVLPAGSSSWDGGLHAPYNNTPEPVLSAFLINDSNYCPSSTTVATHGCITWDLGASGVSWPEFLEIAANSMGASVEPCGAFTYLGAGVQDFGPSSAGYGDGPCTLPGGYTSTTQSIAGVSWDQYVASLSPTLWDPFQILGENYPTPQSAVQWTMVRSGPYYSSNPVNPSVGYNLHDNPAYSAPVGCAGQPGCEPLPGHFIPNVDVVWEPNDTAGLRAMSAGVADTAWFASTESVPVQQDVAQGLYGLVTGIPSLNIYFDPFELNFSLTNLETQDPIGGINVPGSFLSNVGLREFLVNAFPYATDERNDQSVDGLAFGEAYGGMIPHDMGSYYPANISWPSGNPARDPSAAGNVSWWWDQLTNSTSPWYDPTFALCTPSTPCKFPFIGTSGVPLIQISEDDWIASIENLTNGSVMPYQYNLNFGVIAGNVGFAPGQGTMPIYSYGWAPDYPDPTDYLTPTYFPDQTYTYTDAVAEQVGLPQYDNGTACGHTGVDPSNATYGYDGAWANLTYWANGSGGLSGVGVADACQGVAYHAMVEWMDYAAHLSSLPDRTLIYDLTEQIANELALYMYWYQSLVVDDYATWLTPSSVDTNPMIGGSSQQLWYNWEYAYTGYATTFTESGLSPGAAWWLSFGHFGTFRSSTPSITVTGLSNGTFPYSVGYITGYWVSPSNGSIVIAGSNASETVAFTSVSGPTEPVTFYESGLVSGTSWSVGIDRVGSIQGTAPTAVFALPSGTYSYNASDVLGYAPPPAGQIVVGTGPATASIVYVGVAFGTYPVVFVASGLPAGQAWSVTLNGFQLTTTADNESFFEANGSFAWTVSPISGYLASPPNGTVNVSGTGAVITITWSSSMPHFEVTFVEGGLPVGTPWTIMVGGEPVNSTGASLEVELTNGTWSWSAAPVMGLVPNPGYGNVSVSGTEPPPVAIQFRAPTPLYSVTFTAEGASVSAWTLYVGSAAYSQTAAVALVELAAGTYSWGIGLPTGYYATPGGGAVTVTPSGAAVSFTVVQVPSTPPPPPTYSVTFTAHGLTVPSWTLFVGNSSASETVATVTVKLPAGNYSWSVGLPSGYYATPSGGLLEVTPNGATQSFTIAATSTLVGPANPSSTYLSPLATGLIAGLALLAVICAIGLLVVWSRRKPPAQASNSGSSTPPEPSATGTTGK